MDKRRFMEEATRLACLVAAVLTRQTYVLAAPLTAFVWLVVQGRRRRPCPDAACGRPYALWYGAGNTGFAVAAAFGSTTVGTPFRFCTQAEPMPRPGLRR